MKNVVTGLDDDGRSCVVHEHAIDTRRGRATAGRDRGTLGTVWSTDECPPPIERPRDFPLLRGSCPPSGTRWFILGWEPGVVRDTVRTNTLDYDVVLEGSCELILESGSIVLERGDSVVIPGVVHGWRAGPEGVVLSVVLVGLDED